MSFPLPWIDATALAVCLTCWIGYSYFADHFRVDKKNLMSVMHEYRIQWMRRMLARDVRIADVNILVALNRGNALFASTSVFIIAGLMAVLGSLEKARALSETLSFTVDASREVWELKMLTLMFVFVYAFFKFIWSLRQFNFALHLIGAAPEMDEADTDAYKEFPAKAGRIISLGVYTFNGGVRAYYFGLAMLSWFMHPILFMVASIWVVFVLHRRDFRSRTLRTVKDMKKAT